MKLKLTLQPGEISIIERYLPYVANDLGIATLRENPVLEISMGELENLQQAVLDVLVAYGFDENYDANAVGRIAEKLIDSIQNLLEP